MCTPSSLVQHEKLTSNANFHSFFQIRRVLFLKSWTISNEYHSYADLHLVVTVPEVLSSVFEIIVLFWMGPSRLSTSLPENAVRKADSRNFRMAVINIQKGMISTRPNTRQSSRGLLGRSSHAKTACSSKVLSSSRNDLQKKSVALVPIKSWISARPVYWRNYLANWLVEYWSVGWSISRSQLASSAIFALPLLPKFLVSFFIITTVHPHTTSVAVYLAWFS